MTWSWRRQLVGHLLCTALVALLLASIRPAVSAAPPSPFTTAPDMLAVTVEIHAAEPPAILSVDSLAEGRLSLTQSGPYRLMVQDETGAIIHELAFEVVFALPGVHGHRLDSNELIFVVPGRAAAAIVVDGPQGMARWSREES